MNYLAHLYFSQPTPTAWAGSLMGDFVKGEIAPCYPPDLIAHLRLHRRLDAYTQQSVSFQASRRRLDPRFRYGRSILVDVFYDHFLACRWGEFSSESLEQFAQRVYRGLQQCERYLPAPLQQNLPRMIADNWLCSYRSPQTVARVLRRLEERLRHRLPLAEGSAELQRLRPALEEDFMAFMEEVQVQVVDWRAEFNISQQSGGGG